MRFPVLISLILFPLSVSYALSTSEEGNRPLSPANYTDWPGLVDAVNDPSRVYQVWVNGAETMYYHGNTQAANRVLKEFAETQVDELHVVILPGPGDQVEVAKEKVFVDYRINIIGGIVRAHLQRHPSVQSLHPTMTIYCTDQIQLDQLKIPQGVKLFDLYDLESKYRTAAMDEDAALRDEGRRSLEALHAEFRKQGEKYEQMEQQLAEIKKFIAVHGSDPAETAQP